MTQGFAREARIGVDLHVGETLYYTANDTFDKADYEGLYGVRVKVQGGGGAGGGAAATSATEASIGSGGGAGGYSEKIIVAADLGTSETITIGAGGAGNAGDAGGDGSTTSFGSHCSATGGKGGTEVVSTGFNGVFGGAGGLGVAGDLNIDGGGGSAAYVGDIGGQRSLALGDGGGSMLGSGGFAFSTAASAAGGDYGAGGGGTNNNANQSADAGGDGGDGIVIVEVLYERKIAVDEDIHTQYLNDTRHNNAHTAGRWELAANQTIADSTVETLVFDTEIFEQDVDGDVSMNLTTGVLTFNVVGIFVIIGGIQWGASNTGDRLLRFNKNSGTFIAADRRNSFGNSEMQVTTLIQSAVNDTIELEGFQRSGGNLIAAANENTFLAVYKVSE